MSVLNLIISIFFIFLIKSLSIGQSIDQNPIIEKQFIFITPQLYCNNSEIICDGTFDKPYDSLMIALQTIIPKSNVEYTFVFLGTYQTPHYLMKTENISSINQYYDYSNSNQRYFQDQVNVSIKFTPLLCNDPDFQLNDTYMTNCISQDNTGLNNNSDKIILYVKMENFSIFVSGNLTITNMIIDGSENILEYNRNFVNNIDYCLLYRINCCLNAQSASMCQPTPRQIIFDYSQYGIFCIRNYSSYKNPSINIVSSIFQNLLFFHTSTLFELDIMINSFNMQNTIFNKNYFSWGTIYLNNTPQITYWPSFPKVYNINFIPNQQMYINIQQVSFLNYNPYNFTVNFSLSQPGLNYTEGYFMNLQQPIQFKLVIESSTFNKASNSIFSACQYIGSLDIYNYLSYPMTISPNSSFPNKMNISLPFIHDNVQLYTSTLIFLVGMQGDIAIYNSNFMHITGVSGSVFVLDYFTPSSTIDITNNTFIFNYAIRSFPTLRIYTFNPYPSINYYGNNNCNSITLANNIFTNNTGCSGSYGNIIVYCDPNLSDPTTTPILDQSALSSTNLKYQFASMLLLNKTNIHISNNTFSLNKLSFSNSIIIYGFIGVNFDKNIFKGNGVSLQTTLTYWKRNIPYSHPVYAYWFTQSSAVFLTLCAGIKFTNNLFENNWAAISENTLFGTQITIDSLVPLYISIEFINNTFCNNTGVPDTVLKSLMLPLPSLASYVNLPLITINYAHVHENSIGPNGWMNVYPILLDSQIIMNNSSFINNLMNFSYADYSLNNLNDSGLYVTLTSRPENFNGLIRFYTLTEKEYLTQAETFPKVNLTIINSNFINNTLGSIKGCFFSNVWISSIIITNSIFDSNIMYQKELPLDYISFPIYEPNDFHGMVCEYYTLTTSDISQSNPSILIENIIYTNNIGTFLTNWKGISMYASINNSVFYNNTCTDGSIIISFISNHNLALDSNLFNNNLNLFGIYGLSPSPQLQAYNNKYMNNIGHKASIYYIGPSTMQVLEQHSIFTNNTIVLITNPFMPDGITPVGGNIYIDNGTFIDNENIHSYACTYGGMIITVEGTISIYKSVFKNNECYGSGLVLTILSSSYAILDQANIYSNQLMTSALSDNSINKAFFNVFSSTIIMNNSIIVDNVLDQGMKILVGNLANINLYNTSFKNNQQNYAIGYVPYLILSSFSNMMLHQCNFINNSGIMNTINTNINISVSYFNNNQGTETDKTMFQIINGQISIINSTLLDNSETVQTGTYIFAYSTLYVYIQNSIFGNFSVMDGAVLETVKGDITLINVTFNNNHILYGDGDLNFYRVNNLFLDNCTFTHTKYAVSFLFVQGASKPIFITNTYISGYTFNSSIYISNFHDLLIDNITVDSIYAYEYIGSKNKSSLWNQPKNDVGQADLSVQLSGISYSNITIINSYFKGLFCKNGALNLNINSNQLIILQNNMFSQNVGLDGGALYTSFNDNNSTIIINNCAFISNYAQSNKNNADITESVLMGGHGGAIFYHCSNHISCNMTIFNTIFMNNIAEIAGGSIFSDYFPPFIKLDTVLFKNNAAMYGPDLASIPIKLILWKGVYDKGRFTNYDWEQALKLSPILTINQYTMIPLDLNPNINIDKLSDKDYNISNSTQINSSSSLNDNEIEEESSTENNKTKSEYANKGLDLENMPDDLSGNLFGISKSDDDAPKSFLNDEFLDLNYAFSYMSWLQQITNIKKNLISKENFLTLSNTINLTNAVSGQIQNITLKFALMDIYGQIVSFDNYSQIQINFTNSNISKNTPHQDKIQYVTPYSNATSITSQNGFFNLQDFILDYWPDSLLTLNLSTRDLHYLPKRLTKSLKINGITSILTTFFLINLQFRNCTLGETFLSNGKCEICEENYYLINLDNNTMNPCVSCNYVNGYCLGGSNLVPKMGFWRMNSTADLLIPCPSPTACLGINSTTKEFDFTNQCEKGRHGNLCSGCDNDYTRIGSTCVLCEGDWIYYFKFTLVSLLQLSLVIITIKLTLDASSESYSKNGIPYYIIKTNMFKILENYLQIITIISSYSFRWPEGLTQIFSINSKLSATSDDYFSFQCFLKLFDPSIRIYFLNYLIIMLTPIIIIFISFVFWIIYYMIKRRSLSSSSSSAPTLFSASASTSVITSPSSGLKTTLSPPSSALPFSSLPSPSPLSQLPSSPASSSSSSSSCFIYNEDFKNKLITTIVIILFNNQPNLLKYSFKMFQCTNLYRSDLPEYYFNSDYDVLCYHGEHMIWTFTFGLINLILWGLLLPFIITFTFWKNRHHLDDEKFRYKFSFLYRGYQKNRYYWEFINSLRKFMLIAVLIFLEPVSIYLQSILLLIIVLISYLLHKEMSPQINKTLNDMESRSLASALIASISGLYFLTVPSFEALDYLVLIFCGMANAYFFILWILYYTKIFIEGAKEKNYYKKIHLCVNKIIAFFEKISVNLCKKVNKRLSSHLKHLTIFRTRANNASQLNINNSTYNKSPRSDAIFMIKSGEMNMIEGKNHEFMEIVSPELKHCQIDRNQNSFEYRGKKSNDHSVNHTEINLEHRKGMLEKKDNNCANKINEIDIQNSNIEEKEDLSIRINSPIDNQKRPSSKASIKNDDIILTIRKQDKDKDKKHVDMLINSNKAVDGNNNNNNMLEINSIGNAPQIKGNDIYKDQQLQEKIDKCKMTLLPTNIEKLNMIESQRQDDNKIQEIRSSKAKSFLQNL